MSHTSKTPAISSMSMAAPQFHLTDKCYKQVQNLYNSSGVVKNLQARSACVNFFAPAFFNTFTHGFAFAVKAPVCIVRTPFILFKGTAKPGTEENNFTVKTVATHLLKIVAYAVATIALPLFGFFISPKLALWVHDSLGLTKSAVKANMSEETYSAKIAKALKTSGDFVVEHKVPFAILASIGSAYLIYQYGFNDDLAQKSKEAFDKLETQELINNLKSHAKPAGAFDALLDNIQRHPFYAQNISPKLESLSSYAQPYTQPFTSYIASFNVAPAHVAFGFLGTLAAVGSLKVLQMSILTCVSKCRKEAAGEATTLTHASTLGSTSSPVPITTTSTTPRLSFGTAFLDLTAADVPKLGIPADSLNPSSLTLPASASSSSSSSSSSSISAPNTPKTPPSDVDDEDDANDASDAESPEEPVVSGTFTAPVPASFSALSSSSSSSLSSPTSASSTSGSHPSLSPISTVSAKTTNQATLAKEVSDISAPDTTSAASSSSAPALSSSAVIDSSSGTANSSTLVAGLGTLTLPSTPSLSPRAPVATTTSSPTSMAAETKPEEEKRQGIGRVRALLSQFEQPSVLTNASLKPSDLSVGTTVLYSTPGVTPASSINIHISSSASEARANLAQSVPLGTPAVKEEEEVNLEEFLSSASQPQTPSNTLKPSSDNLIAKLNLMPPVLLTGINGEPLTQTFFGASSLPPRIEAVPFRFDEEEDVSLSPKTDRRRKSLPATLPSTTEPKESNGSPASPLGIDERDFSSNVTSPTDWNKLNTKLNDEKADQEEANRLAFSSTHTTPAHIPPKPPRRKPSVAPATPVAQTPTAGRSKNTSPIGPRSTSPETDKKSPTVAAAAPSRSPQASSLSAKKGARKNKKAK